MGADLRSFPVFAALAIVDDVAHTSEIFIADQARPYKKLTIFIKSSLDEKVDVQLVGGESNSFVYPENIGAAKELAATTGHCAFVLTDFYGALKLVATAQAGPGSGSISAKLLAVELN